MHNVMDQLVEQLHAGNHSLVVGNGGTVTAYDGRGLQDLLRLLADGKGVLKGASVADKVVGKAAAALMIEGGVVHVYAELVSTQAVKLFESYGVAFSYGALTDHIINRAGTGWCPMELCCRDLATPAECHAAILHKIEEFKQQKQ